MLSAGGGCEIMVNTRVKTAWKKFREHYFPTCASKGNLFIVPVCWVFVFGPCFVMQYLVSFIVLHSSH